MNKKAKSAETAQSSNGTKAFFSKEWTHLKRHQEIRQSQVRRAQRLLDTVTSWAPAENNVAQLILERLDGFGKTGSYSDELIIAFKEVLSTVEGDGSGRFIKWYQKWMADITFRLDHDVLWCEEDDWVVFLSLAQFFTSNDDIEACGKTLLSRLANVSYEEDDNGAIDWKPLVKTFLSKLDNDPFIERFVPPV